MATTGTYLTFPGAGEDAFGFYKTVFGTEYQGGVMRMGDGPMWEGGPELSDADKRLVMNVALPILGGHVIMGSDHAGFMGFPLEQGNAVQIVLDPDTRADAARLFAALADGGTVRDQLQEMFWGDYYGALLDRFGVQWLVNCTSKS